MISGLNPSMNILEKIGGDWRIRTAGFTVLQTVPLDCSGKSPIEKYLWGFC
jgi:hypothetical protein